ncbi:histidine kinase [Paraburkholderia bonniea]|uniref:sensor histidine kinase n=1 Tax=Paraburkholderia bonniea TaxID=2152891 RepID=UPI001FE77820|nr:histidine kinase [Paraburkholderia bonniea]WJF91531.1 histidine kinase [Paraburkholderia bonniea]WJF94850.1 histidine kinase [Paraburkholderia bonniea]
MQKKPSFISLPGMTRRDSEPHLLARVFLLNCLIGLCFWISGREASLLSYLVMANSIGFSAWLFSALFGLFTRVRLALPVRVLIVAPLSVVSGMQIAALLGGRMPPLLSHLKLTRWVSLVPTFLIVGIACAFASVFVQSLKVRAALEKQRREAAELRQSETAARLALLQAQIEPHFLFNTLANVRSLIERDPSAASAMLDNLNRYLRASLGRTRKPVSSLEEELELIDALLSIAAMRLGNRLRYTITLPPALRFLPLPPLLFQPLVENALIHGVEPSIEGGEIHVDVEREANMLRLRVVDTGVGLSRVSKLYGGVGLSNVRARLATLYGGAAHLSIESNPIRGVTAQLLIPLQ